MPIVLCVKDDKNGGAHSPLPSKANLYTQVCIHLNNNKLKKRYTLKKKEEKGRKKIFK